MKFLHSMVRVQDLDASIAFYRDILGLVETRRFDVPAGKFTLVYLATAIGEPEVELTYNWGSTEEYDTGRNFGHLAFEVDNIYDFCQKVLDAACFGLNRSPISVLSDHRFRD